MESAESLTLDGRRLAWRRIGGGDPLLLVNGYAATAVDWDPTFLAGLAERFEVICPDNRGLGDSELGDTAAEPLTADSMAADLEAVLDAIGIGGLPVVGWSMGGFVAQRLAARAGRATCLALLSTDPGGPAAKRADPAVWARLTNRSGTPREQASRLISLLFPAEFAAVVDREFGDAVAAAREALDPAALGAQEEAMDAWHAAEQPAPEPPPPTLVICGAEDEVIPAANGPLLAERFAAELDVRAGRGHGLMAQEPTELAARIAAFAAR